MMRKREKKKGRGKKSEKWRVERIQSGTSVGGDLDMAIVPCLVLSGGAWSWRRIGWEISRDGEQHCNEAACSYRRHVVLDGL